MQKIKQLPLHEAQKIAAGEVVERPANAIKELIENALDAGATQITLSVKNAGSDSIIITDNGCGMSPEDAHLCFKQYATSKIRHVDELSSISTFGFRGEALSSIAAISRMTLITKESDSLQGTRLELEQGTVIEEACTPCNAGTTIIIRDLFYNVPARKKFLKKRDTEWRQIQNIFYAFCLDYLNVHFKLEHDDRLVLNCPSVSSLNNRFAQLWDPGHAQNMLPVESKSENSSLKVDGIISNHQLFYYDRSHIFLFVNKRWIKNHALAKAIIKGYLNVIPSDRYPAACIFITIDPEEIDVNIHPRKEEIQFLHPRIVEQLIQNAIRQALEKNISRHIHQPAPAEPENNRFLSAPAFSTKVADPFFFIPEPFAQINARPFETRPQIDRAPSQFFTPQYTPPIPVETSITEQTEFIMEPTELSSSLLIGQYHKTYLLIEQESGLFLIDQHAAHERILYEQFSKRFDNVSSTKLLFPVIMHLSKQEIALVEPHLYLFKENGIEIDVFGNDQLIIQATPVHAKNIDVKELIHQVIGWITENSGLDQDEFTKKIHEKMHAQMACKAAVKAGDVLTNEQMHQLLADLAATNNRFTCPHGRPTGWLLSLHEIEKKFRRKL